MVKTILRGQKKEAVDSDSSPNSEYRKPLHIMKLLLKSHKRLQSNVFLLKNIYYSILSMEDDITNSA